MLTLLGFLALALTGFLTPAAHAQTDPVISLTDGTYNGAGTERTIGVRISYSADSGGVHFKAKDITCYLLGDCNHSGTHTNSGKTWTHNVSLESSTILVSGWWSATITRNTGGMFQDGGVCTCGHNFYVEIEEWRGGVYYMTHFILPSNTVTNTVLQPTATTGMHIDPCVKPNGAGNWY